MPRATLPPTPASSTDMKGKDGSKLASLQMMAFELPPPAILPADAAVLSPSTAGPTLHTSPSSSSSNAVYPVQPSETVKARRRSSAAQGPPKDQFTLPPPPTRSRKIIQMKPRKEATPEPARPAATKSASSAKGNNNTSAATTTLATAAGTKRKQPSATSAAGRKIARKTAHSLIERRRRSKMNEEFAVLKDMIPACDGEMHKLAILQASIEYVRYLEDCVAKLKAQREPQSRRQEAELMGLPSPSGATTAAGVATPSGANSSSDVDMTGSEVMSSPAFTPNAGRSQQPSVSPALLAEDYSRRDNRHNSYSSSASTTADYHHHRQHSYGGGGG
ncbi:hypothetical protein B0T17DRAFT_463164, partial [Bombardia bombarda]